jgi:hypothetical protein
VTIRAFRASALRAVPQGAQDRDLGRLLALLEANTTGGVRIAALPEAGIEASLQAVYELQLAGYEVERVCCARSNGEAIFGYQLRGRVADSREQPHGLKGVHDDDA